MQITVLGSGHSGGTPMIGEGWGNADPKNPKNYRTRPSILVENNKYIARSPRSTACSRRRTY